MDVNKPKLIPKKPKSTHILEKEARARKQMKFTRCIKSEERPIWTKEYVWPQYETCKPFSPQAVYDKNDWKPCGHCHECGQTYYIVASGFEEMTFERVNSY